MLIAQKITKKHLPQVKEAARRFMAVEGPEVVRASMNQFPGNTVIGIFDDSDGRIVGWKIVDSQDRVLSSLGTTAVENDDMPIFERVADPFYALEEKIDSATVEDTVQSSAEEMASVRLLQNAIKADEFLMNNPHVGRRSAKKIAYSDSGDSPGRSGSSPMMPASYAFQGKNKKKMKPLGIVLGVLLTILVAGGGAFSIYTAYKQLSDQEAEVPQELSDGEDSPPDWSSYNRLPAGEIAHVNIEMGDDVPTMALKLAEAGAPQVAAELENLVEELDAYSLLVADDYIVTGDESATSFVNRLIAGQRVPSGVMGINTGDTITTIAESIGRASLPFTEEEFLESARNVEKWRGEFGMLSDVPQGLPSLEGYFQSGEYDLASCATADDAVRYLLSGMEKQFEASGMSSADYHALLTKASLIEKEALFDEDRALISSVIDNRLAAGALLQIDAAVKYANNYDEARVYDSQLEIDSPYNTYMYEGLPIGPICSGIDQKDLEAAQNPEQTDFFYYVLADKEGHHTFCVTDEEFAAAKNHYLEIFGYAE